MYHLYAFDRIISTWASFSIFFDLRKLPFNHRLSKTGKEPEEKALGSYTCNIFYRTILEKLFVLIYNQSICLKCLLFIASACLILFACKASTSLHKKVENGSVKKPDCYTMKPEPT